MNDDVGGVGVSNCWNDGIATPDLIGSLQLTVRSAVEQSRCATPFPGASLLLTGRIDQTGVSTHLREELDTEAENHKT